MKGNYIKIAVAIGIGIYFFFIALQKFPLYFSFSKLNQIILALRNIGKLIEELITYLLYLLFNFKPHDLHTILDYF